MLHFIISEKNPVEYWEISGIIQISDYLETVWTNLWRSYYVT